MKIICLVENTSDNKSLKSKHGICFYIETLKHKILFDLGSNGLFLENAKKMNVDIKSIDTVIISHGHVDHGGALRLFFKENSTAKVYVKASAFEKHTTALGFLKINVGLEAKLKEHNQIVFTEDIHMIDDELLVFVSKTRDFPLPISNQKLFMYENQEYKVDNFYHEQSLLIHDRENWVLFGGCAHSGIVNIVNQAQTISKHPTHTVISGFHLYNPVSKAYESDSYIEQLGKELSIQNTNFYTCHCTGNKAFDILKSTIQSNLNYISTGDTIII